jgi:4-amino-4-deoxy-L-arabinose transferase-like glycosyltransferase
VSSSDYSAAGLGERRPLVLEAARAVSTEVWILLALIALAAVIRIVTLDNQSLWADEALTSYEAGLPFGAMLHTVAHVETTPPLYFVIVWAWTRIFGPGAVALRSVSAIAGVAVVPIAYACTRELVSRRAGLIAAALAAVNPFMVWYSQEARAYMLLTALTGASFLFFARALRDPSRRNLVWWAGLSAAAVTTHFFAGFAVAPEALWLLWKWRRRSTVLAVAVVAVVQAAMLPFAFNDTSHGLSWIAAIHRINRIAQTVTQWGVSNLYRRTTTPEGLAAGVLLAVAVVLLVHYGGDAQTRPGAKVAAVIAAVVFVGPLVLGFAGQDYFLARNELPAFIPVMTLLGAACAAPRARAAGAVLAVALLAVFCFATFEVQTHLRFERPDWARVARALGPAGVPRAILAADGTTADPLKVYLPGVSWVEPHARRTLVREIDVVGTKKKLRVAYRMPYRRALPVSVAPRGTRLLARFRVANWVIARFALPRPERVSIDSLNRIASRFFRHTPLAVLVFVQRRER